MTYALRKLIAFVFLGGIFWFIYQDLDNIDKPWFMHALGMLAVAFACFWLVIPSLVVWLRIRRRRAQNRERHGKWLAEGGVANVGEMRVRGFRPAVEPGERLYFHEKGTLYICRGASEFSVESVLDRPVGRPSDVAFPGWRDDCRVVQRTHCYFTNRRVVFVGKGVEVDVQFAALKSAAATPGGIVFVADRGASEGRFAFTFQNPLVAEDVLRFAREGK